MKLFIGGSKDGQRLKVPDIAAIQVPKAGVTHETEKYHKTVVVGPEGDQAYVYLHESISPARVAHELIKGYK